MAGNGIQAQWHIIKEPWDAMQVDLQRASDRATMYALRAVGRSYMAAAKKRAPVYQGDDPRAQAESGNLRRSIKNSRMIRRGGGVYQMNVMPAGSKRKGTNVTRASGPSRRTGGRQGARGVPLYRRQMEEMYGYMAYGHNVASATALAIYEDAYRKAFAKYAP